MKSMRFLVVAALAAGLIAAGCGGGGGDGGGDRLTKEEFVSQADQFCQQANDKFNQIQTDLQDKVKANPAAAKQTVEDFAKQLAPVLRDTVNNIASLKPPEDLQSKLDDFKTKANDFADEIEKDPAALAQSTDASTKVQELNQLASDLGLQSCGPGT